eukprot:Amastigsp_a843951_62.p2 type:complete len:183 gc:universal Amastigsp_a843951_62:206-754(+)
MSMATVIGPTPPGTGVIKDATPCASAKETSPTNRNPAFLDGSSRVFMATSMTTTPGRSQSPRTSSAWPTAAIRMSAFCTSSLRFAVLEWHTVTVAFSRRRHRAAGMPTMFDRPSTTACLPSIVTPERRSSSMHPLGVHATASGFRPRIASEPMFCGWNPSTSFSREIASRTRASFMWLGSGS